MTLQYAVGIRVGSKADQVTVEAEGGPRLDAPSTEPTNGADRCPLTWRGTTMQQRDKDLLARTVSRLPLDIACAETRAALEDNAALAAYLLHIARLRHFRRLPSTEAARAAGWTH